MSVEFRTVHEQAIFAFDDGRNTSIDAVTGLRAGSEFPSVLCMWSRWAFVLVLVAILTRLLTTRREITTGTKRLPRLTGLPWIGRFPISGAGAACHVGELRKTYGPIYEWVSFGVTHVWIEDDRIASDLLIHRSHKYTDNHARSVASSMRPEFEIPPLVASDEQFWYHKMFVRSLRQTTAQHIIPSPSILESRNTLRHFLDHPERWPEHIVTHCARTAASIAWGDPRHGTKLLAIVLKPVSPTRRLTKRFPFLGSFPQFNILSRDKEYAYCTQMQDAFDAAQHDVVERCKAGTAVDCWTKLWYEQTRSPSKSHLYDRETALVIGTNAFVTIATLGSALHSFFTAICRYPSWLPRVQDEIDHVCGNRLPDLQDLPHLPTLRAVIKETLRWRHPAPFGVPHVATEDDVYNGYMIKKGSVVHAHHHIISRAPSIYPHGDEWKPDRWLDPAYPTFRGPLTEFPTLRDDVGFGSGVVTDLVLKELFTVIGAFAWAFDIKRKEGRVGYQNSALWAETSPFIVAMAKPSACEITPRSAAKAHFIANGCYHQR